MRNKLLADFYQQLNPDNSMTFNRLLAHSLGAVETIILFTLIGKYYYYADKEMIDENKTQETTCHFCGNKYYFTKEDLDDLYKIAKEKECKTC